MLFVKHRPEDILDAAMRLFDAEGVGVSTSKVAKAAGVANGTLFNYFPSKQELIDALYVRLKTQLGQALGDIDETLPLRDQTKLIWDRWIAWGRANPEARRVSRLLHESGLASPDAAASVDAALAAPMGVLQRLGASGELADLPLDYIGAITQAHLELAVEQLFNVKVANVRTVNMKGKTKRQGLRRGKRSDWKKAYVSLEQGHEIDLASIGG